MQHSVYKLAFLLEAVKICSPEVTFSVSFILFKCWNLGPFLWIEFGLKNWVGKKVTVHNSAHPPTASNFKSIAFLFLSCNTENYTTKISFGLKTYEITSNLRTCVTQIEFHKKNSKISENSCSQIFVVCKWWKCKSQGAQNTWTLMRIPRGEIF